MSITGTIRGSSKEKLYQELGFESLQLRCWYRKLGMFYKIYKNKSPKYLFKLIPEKTHAYATRNVDNIPCFKIRHNFFKNFPSTIIEWNNLDPTLRNSKSFVDFKNSILKFIRPFPSNVFKCNNYKAITLITRMSHLREHKFKHNSQDSLNPICSCSSDIESTSHFVLQCPTFYNEQYTLLSTLNNIDCKLLEPTELSLSQTLLYGNTLFDKEKSTHILNTTIEYILSTERFEEPLT